MNEILWVSGFVAAICACLFVVLPTLFVGLNYKHEPMSIIVMVPHLGRIFRVGLVATALFLLFFIVWLTMRFVEYSPFLGMALYVFGSICMIVVACITIDSNQRVHTMFTKGYFFLSTVGALVFSLTIHQSLPIVLALIGGIGTAILYFKMGVKAYSEYWGITFAILWVLSFYIL